MGDREQYADSVPPSERADVLATELQRQVDLMREQGGFALTVVRIDTLAETAALLRVAHFDGSVAP